MGIVILFEYKMKRTFNVNSLLLIASVFICGLCSCAKTDTGTPPPSIVFIKGAGYMSADAAVAKGSVVNIGIIAKAAIPSDSLTKLTVVRTYDNTYDSTLLSYTITGSEADSVNKVVNYTTRNILGAERYTFTITSKSGAVNSLKILFNTY